MCVFVRARPASHKYVFVHCTLFVFLSVSLFSLQYGYEEYGTGEVDGIDIDMSDEETQEPQGDGVENTEQGEQGEELASGIVTVEVDSDDDEEEIILEEGVAGEW